MPPLPARWKVKRVIEVPNHRSLRPRLSDALYREWKIQDLKKTLTYFCSGSWSEILRHVRWHQAFELHNCESLPKWPLSLTHEKRVWSCNSSFEYKNRLQWYNSELYSFEKENKLNKTQKVKPSASKGKTWDEL